AVSTLCSPESSTSLSPSGVLAFFCSRGLLLLILCRDARCSPGVAGGAVPFARIASGRERASPTATGGCEEPAAAQASEVHRLPALCHPPPPQPARCVPGRA